MKTYFFKVYNAVPLNVTEEEAEILSELLNGKSVEDASSILCDDNIWSKPGDLLDRNTALEDMLDSLDTYDKNLIVEVVEQEHV